MKAALIVAFLAACYAIAGTIDYGVLHAAAEDRARPAQEEARIWSRKCARQGKDALLVKADGGPWQARCMERRTLAIPRAEPKA